MKESKFNFFLNDDNSDNIALFNSQTTALAIINSEELKVYNKLKTKNFEIDDIEEETLLKELKKGGFIVDQDIDETEILRYLQKCAQFSTDSLSLTIAPTLGCNFGCIYCYQGNHDSFSKMSIEIQDKLIDFVKNSLPKITSLDITWYGGEPLLAMEIIERLSLEFLKLCSDNNISYNASIITNGYYLTKDIAHKFNDLQIKSVQVTLDGDKEYHDSKRPLKDGSGTFDSIISNIIDVKGIFNNISIRLNTDNYNKDHVLEIIDVLKKNDILDIAVPYLGYIEPTNDCYDTNNCLSQIDFINIEHKFFNELSKNIDIDIMTTYPQPKLNSCLADSVNGYVIDPFGTLSKCWCDIGFDEYSIGNINDGLIKYDRLIEYFNYDVFNDPKCKDCNIIPLCLGGCPRKRADNKDEHCANIKYSLKDTLIKIIKSKNSTIQD